MQNIGITQILLATGLGSLALASVGAGALWIVERCWIHRPEGDESWLEAYGAGPSDAGMHWAEATGCIAEG